MTSAGAEDVRLTLVALRQTLGFGDYARTLVGRLLENRPLSGDERAALETQRTDLEIQIGRVQEQADMLQALQRRPAMFGALPQGSGN